MFPPAFAPRMGYLCKYLNRLGWEPTVVTEYISDSTFSFLSEYANVTYVHYYKFSKKFFRFLEWIFVMFADILFHYKSRKIVKACAQHFKKNQFDCILCSTYRTFPLPAAHILSLKYNIPFIADLRDIIEQYTHDEYISHKIHIHPLLDKWILASLRSILLKERNKILKVANAITTVSPWHVEVLKAYNPNVKLIYNGYDPELFYPQKIHTEHFLITYTGRILSLSLQNPELLFEAISQLSEAHEIDPETVRVQWYITQESLLNIQPMITQYHIDEYMDYHEYVPASHIPQILNSSSILLSLTNKSNGDGPKGILGTKFYESLAVEKPILSIRSDQSYIAQVIKDTNAGLAATNVKEVCDFIRFHYNEWKKNGYTSVNINRNQLNIFSRREQAKQFINIFNEVKNGK